jgi:lactate permease
MGGFFQALPLLLLLVLLVSGRAGPIAACLVALAAALPAVAVSLPPGAGFGGFLWTETLRAIFLGLQPVAVLSGGLLFSAAAAPPVAGAVAPSPRRVFVLILAGTFVESVTGFGVGAVFTLTSLRAMGLSGASAGAMALMSLCLVPWGGLGPGTALGAALAGRPVAELSFVTALPQAAWLVTLPPVLWALLRREGMAVPWRERAAQAGMQAAVAALLLLAARFLPFEAAGIAATGPVLLIALWRLDPPRDARARRRAAAVLGPWILLTACLLGARLWHGAPAWQPFGDLPAWPVTHAATVLWSVSLLLLAWRPDGMARLRALLPRVRRPAVAMLLYVVLGRWLAGSGAAAALASGIAGALGGLAPFAIPPLGLLAGLVTGSNVGSVSALMPVQVGLGAAVGLPPWLAPGLHNFSGAVGAGVSFAVTAIICGLLADGTRPAALWRLLLPAMLTALLAGLGTVALLR